MCLMTCWHDPHDACARRLSGLCQRGRAMAKMEAEAAAERARLAAELAKVRRVTGAKPLDPSSTPA